jgi:hypothetical protein
MVTLALKPERECVVLPTWVFAYHICADGG